MDLYLSIWVGDDFGSSKVILIWKEKGGFNVRNKLSEAVLVCFGWQGEAALL